MQQAKPFVSVLMPIRNESAFIDKTLRAVLSQTYPAEKMEIIVIDGASTDGTKETVNAFKEKHSNVILLDSPGKIVAKGLNLGIRKASGSILVRVDGHTVIAPDYVEKCVETLMRTEADNVGGTMKSAGENFFGKTAALATSTPFGVGGARFHYSTKEEWVDTVYLGAWKKEIFQEMGLFDEEMVRNQDDEFNYRMLENGKKILLSPAIQSSYFVRSSPQKLWAQYFQYGYWKVRVMQKHPRQIRLRQIAPALLVGGLTGFLILGLFSKTATALFWVLLFLYLAANSFASVYASRKQGISYLRCLPLVYAILHISYGAGFLTGLIKFRGRWKT